MAYLMVYLAMKVANHLFDVVNEMLPLASSRVKSGNHHIIEAQTRHGLQAFTHDSAQPPARPVAGNCISDFLGCCEPNPPFSEMIRRCLHDKATRNRFKTAITGKQKTGSRRNARYPGQQS
tara:strand:- start:715 stop:1077 length:363 start_codon:yes stop_codon:yes gene_type:complete